MEPALVSTYSVGCFQARVTMVDSGDSLAEYGSSNYAQLKWKDSNARGFLRALSRVLQQVLLLSRLLAHLYNSTLPDHQDIDALLPGAPTSAESPVNFSIRMLASWITA